VYCFKNLADIFGQSNLDFKPVEKALFIADEQNMIVIGKEIKFRIISQMELTGCLKRNHMYLFDKQQAVRTDLEDTCLGALYLKSELGNKTGFRISQPDPCYRPFSFFPE
jgi:hypothetical protein